jgi:hypothetical protein
MNRSFGHAVSLMCSRFALSVSPSATLYAASTPLLMHPLLMFVLHHLISTQGIEYKHIGFADDVDCDISTKLLPECLQLIADAWVNPNHNVLVHWY